MSTCEYVNKQGAKTVYWISSVHLSITSPVKFKVWKSSTENDENKPLGDAIRNADCPVASVLLQAAGEKVHYHHKQLLFIGVGEQMKPKPCTYKASALSLSCSPSPPNSYLSAVASGAKMMYTDSVGG
jgi:hypothetical protein